MINYSTKIQFRIDPSAFTNCTAKGNICYFDRRTGKFPPKCVFQYFSSDPCQLKSTTAQSVDDVIEIPSNKKNPSKVCMNTSTMVEVDIEEEDGDDDHAPIQKTIRRGGVSAEAIQEEDLGDYEKKVCIKGTMQCNTIFNL